MNSELFHKLIHKSENHNFLHHVAEEEFPSCKVSHIKTKGLTLQIFADCRDKARNIGLQADLSDKIERRLKLHKMRGLPKFKVHVFHQPSSEGNLTPVISKSVNNQL